LSYKLTAERCVPYVNIVTSVLLNDADISVEWGRHVKPTVRDILERSLSGTGKHVLTKGQRCELRT
jgi:hypothetical protein